MRRPAAAAAGRRPGENCYALYLPAYTPAAMLSPIPMSKKILRGKAMADYDDQPVDPGAGQPVAYFMPCEPFENTAISDVALFVDVLEQSDQAPLVAAGELFACAFDVFEIHGHRSLSFMRLDMFSPLLRGPTCLV